MTITDGMINGILRDMGVEPNKPARWKTYIHKCIDQSTGEVYRTMEDGYFCSKCGKRSYYKKSVCDGCNSQMPKESEDTE